ncbi:MAG: class I SAM-dependent methyltransferase [Bacteroidota bacterium]
MFDFNTFANRYDDWFKTDYGQWIDKTEKTLVEKYLNRFETRTILEIGSGTGHWTDFLSKKDFFILGIDIAEDMLNIARKKNIPRAAFMYNDVENLPYNDRSIDNIVAFTSLEFVNNQNKAFDEIYRVLRKNGVFLIGTLNKKGSLAMTKKKREWLKAADLFTFETLYDCLSVFGKPEIEGCAILPLGYDDLQKAEESEKISSPSEKMESGNFLLGFVKKM